MATFLQGKLPAVLYKPGKEKDSKPVRVYAFEKRQLLYQQEGQWQAGVSPIDAQGRSQAKEEEDASGETRASWEAGQDDLPNWDRAVFSEATGTLTMNCVDLNSLYALDAWCLAQMARILKNEQEFASYTEEYEQMRDLINDNLWNETDGFYYDRYWICLFDL